MNELTASKTLFRQFTDMPVQNVAFVFQCINQSVILIVHVLFPFVLINFILIIFSSYIVIRMSNVFDLRSYFVV